MFMVYDIKVVVCFHCCKNFMHTFMPKNAWCITCLNYHKEQLWQSDVISAAISSTSGECTDADQEAQGSYLII